MKHLLTILLVSICFASFAQTRDTTFSNPDPNLYSFPTMPKAQRRTQVNNMYRIYVTTETDPSGGWFTVHDSTEGYKVDGGTILAVPGTSQVMVRDMSETGGETNARWFGLKADKVTDDAPGIQAAIDYVYKRGGGKVLIPGGNYRVSKIILKDQVVLCGEAGWKATKIYAKQLTETDTLPYGLVEIDKGVVQSAGIKYIDFILNETGGSSSPANNAHQWGWYFRNQYDSLNVQGGLRNSVFEECQIVGSTNGIWTRGGYRSGSGSGLLPMQHLNFIKIDVQIQANGVVYRATGQHGQIYWQGGKLRGLGVQKTKWNIEITNDPAPAQIAKNGVHGESSSDTAGGLKTSRRPNNITFAFGNGPQNAIGSIYVGGSWNISFLNIWLENTYHAITIADRARIAIQGLRFANAADPKANPYPDSLYVDDGDTSYVTTDSLKGGAILFYTRGGGYVEWLGGNAMAGRVGHIMELDTSAGQKTKLAYFGYDFPKNLNYYSTIAGYFPTSGIVQVQLGSTGMLDVGAHEYLLLNADSTRRVELDSVIGYTAPGHMVTILCADNITVNSAGNIKTTTGTMSRTTFRAGSTFTLLRVIGDPRQWTIITPPDNHASQMPVDSQYYANGTIIWNSNTSYGQPVGWRCTNGGISTVDATFETINTKIKGLLSSTIDFITSTTGTDFKIDSVPGAQQVRFNLPSASTTARGLVTVGNQDFTGTKSATIWKMTGTNAGATTDSTVVRKSDGTFGTAAPLSALGGGGTTYWQRSGTSLSPLTTGDNVTGISGLSPDVNNSRDIGASTNNWSNVYTATVRGATSLTLRSGTSLQPIIFNISSVEKMRLFQSGNLVIGSTTDVASSILTLASTTQGFLPPRMTTTQRTAISSPAEGLEVYDTDLHKLYVWDGTIWQAAW